MYVGHLKFSLGKFQFLADRLQHLLESIFLADLAPSLVLKMK